MTDANQPPVHTAKLLWSEDGVPVSGEFDDIYFSKQSGLAESEYVFLQNNQLEQRLGNLHKVAQAHFHIGETGFGTGLNFLSCWRLRDRVAPRCRLSFTSVEKFPLTPQDLARALSAWPELQRYADQLLRHYPPLTPGWHRLSFFDAGVELNLYLGDVLDGYRDYQGTVNAWFLDGFAPAKNTAMWSQQLFNEMARLSDSGTTFSTFTAAAAVREGLKQAGFSVVRTDGFGRKRHMLTGEMPITAAQSATKLNPRQQQNPWFISSPGCHGERRVVILGGGLAGAFSAYSLVRRGWQVELIEQHQQLGTEASGNRQGVLYNKISAEANTLSAFYTAGYLYALQSLEMLRLRHGDESGWHPCGVLQLAFDAQEQQRQVRFLKHNPQPETLVYPVEAAQASALAGIQLPSGGLFYPTGGWATPAQICFQVTNHANITKRFGVRVEHLEREGPNWLLTDVNGELVTRCEQLILANAKDAARLALTSYLPIKTIRGQTTDLPANPAHQLKTVLCGKGYIGPQIDDRHYMGATFNLDCTEQNCRDSDHHRNINEISAMIPEYARTQGFAAVTHQDIGGRVGFRCSSPDYLPLVGPVPDREQFIRDYSALRKDALTSFDTPGPYLPGLYLSIGHGSKGLASCPIAAELLAAYITAEPFPFATGLIHALNPARFLIRDLKRRKI